MPLNTEFLEDIQYRNYHTQCLRVGSLWMTANISSEHTKTKLHRACLFSQERTVRCLLLVSALCLVGCEGNKSKSPCTLSLLGHRWKGEVKPSPDQCPGSSFRALLKAAMGR